MKGKMSMKSNMIPIQRIKFDFMDILPFTTIHYLVERKIGFIGKMKEQCPEARKTPLTKMEISVVTIRGERIALWKSTPTQTQTVLILVSFLEFQVSKIYFGLVFQRTSTRSVVIKIHLIWKQNLGV